MSAQGTLFILPQAAHARHSDPITSEMAAATVNIGLGQMVVLSILTKIREGTDEAIWEAISIQFPDETKRPISQSGARTRRKELTDAGYIKNSGRLGVTKAGRKTIIWEACK